MNPFADTLELTQILYTEQQIAERVKQLAFTIDRAYCSSDAGQLVLVGALTGAFVFLADLSRAIKTPHTISFVRASSYHGGTESSGTVEVGDEIERLDIEGKDVLIVEDILDSGLTYLALRKALMTRNPKSIQFCSLLSKPAMHVYSVRKGNLIRDEMIGFQLRPPRFVVGYGLDYQGCLRGLPFIAEAREKEK
jgi:hypoxanthine phosphoribosyltransferase